MRGGDAQDAVGRCRRLETQRLRNALQMRALRRREIEPHLAAEETIGAEPAQHEVGVGNGRLGAAPAIAGRSRLRRRRFAVRRAARRRADARDAAAAGADFLNVDHRDLDRQPAVISADERAAGRQRAALRMTPAFAVVPPMSKAMAFFRPSRRTAPWCR